MDLLQQRGDGPERAAQGIAREVRHRGAEAAHGHGRAQALGQVVVRRGRRWRCLRRARRGHEHEADGSAVVEVYVEIEAEIGIEVGVGNGIGVGIG